MDCEHCKGKGAIGAALTRIPENVSGATVWALRDDCAVCKPGEKITVDADVVFELCVELELHRLGQYKRIAQGEA